MSKLVKILFLAFFIIFLEVININNEIIEMKKVLNEKEFEIVYAIYYENKTFDALGKKYKISRERVRQICAISLTKLSNAGFKINKEKSNQIVIEESKLRNILSKIDELVIEYKKKIEIIDKQLDAITNDYLRNVLLQSMKSKQDRITELKKIHTRISNYLNNLKT